METAYFFFPPEHAAWARNLVGKLSFGFQHSMKSEFGSHGYIVKIYGARNINILKIKLRVTQKICCIEFEKEQMPRYQIIADMP